MEKKLTNEEITKFYNELLRHDWYYQYSDDYAVWRAGERSRANLLLTAKTHPVYSQMMQDYSAYIFSGKSFQTEKQPQPQLEQYINKGV